MRTIFLIMIGLSSFLSADFTRNAATGIVTDNTTGLMWQDDTLGDTASWQDAIDRCEALSLGGFTDWWLPKQNELVTLIDDTKIRPTINALFQNILSNYYWSSTIHDRNSNLAWYVNFTNGLQDYNFKSSNSYVCCVRAEE